MVTLFRVLMALNLAGVVCPVFIPSTHDYLPFGGNEFTQLSLTNVLYLFVLEISDAIRKLRRRAAAKSRSLPSGHFNQAATTRAARPPAIMNEIVDHETPYRRPSPTSKGK